MSAAEKPVLTSVPVQPATSVHEVQPQPAPGPHGRPWWQKLAVPALVLFLAAAIVVTLTRNWNAWEGGRIQQITDDAFVRGDVTPLSTKVAGIVKEVKVSDYQQVQKGDLLVALEDDDYSAQVAQAAAAVEAARAAIENNRRQRELQDARIERALAGVDQANAEVSAAESGEEAVRADVVRTQKERKRQEALLLTSSSTQQRVEQVVADEQRFAAQLSAREADLAHTKAALQSNERTAEAERRTKSVLESQDLQLIADLHAKEAALAVAKVNLGYTRIAAPENGNVGERQVRVGQLVSPGTPVIAFVSDTKWVQANYRETQLTNMKVGDLAELRIDTYPGKVFSGRVIEIAPASGSQFALLPPDNATGNYTKVVQRIPVKISFDDANAATALRPGLSVIATIRTKH
jgi:membrane fusion protein, multidrug efflux system